MIRLKYRINGVLFRQKFPVYDALAALLRAKVLEENDIAVEVLGLPRCFRRSNDGNQGDAK